MHLNLPLLSLIIPILTSPVRTATPQLFPPRPPSTPAPYTDYQTWPTFKKSFKHGIREWDSSTLQMRFHNIVQDIVVVDPPKKRTIRYADPTRKAYSTDLVAALDALIQASQENVSRDREAMLNEDWGYGVKAPGRTWLRLRTNGPTVTRWDVVGQAALEIKHNMASWLPPSASFEVMARVPYPRAPCLIRMVCGLDSKKYYRYVFWLEVTTMRDPEVEKAAAAVLGLDRPRIEGGGAGTGSGANSEGLGAGNAIEGGEAGNRVGNGGLNTNGGIGGSSTIGGLSLDDID